MDRVNISWNVPNLITINLMAWIGFLVFAIATQTVGKRGSRGAPTSSGSDEIAGPVFEQGY